MFNSWCGYSRRYAKMLLRTLHFLAVFLLMILFFTAKSTAQNVLYYNITGYVYDRESGEPLPWANVVLKGTILGSSTNVNGYFAILTVPAVICSLQVSYVGYLSENIIIDNRKPLEAPLKIQLTPKPMVETIVVSADINMVEITREPSKITVSPRQLVILPNMGEVDIFRSLQLLPPISGANDGSSGLYIRGGTPDQNLILFDGMKIYHVDHFFGFFSAFNSDAIMSVKLYKGGFPAEYGGRISSVVDMTGKTGSTTKPSLRLGANLLNFNGLFEIKPFDKSTFLFSVRRSYTDYVKSSLYEKIYGFLTGNKNTGRIASGFNMGPRGNSQFTQAETTPDFYFYDINSKFTWLPTQGDILSFSIYSGKDYLDQSTDFGGTSFRFGESNATSSMNIGDITDWGNTGLSGKWSHLWSDRLYSHILISHSTYFSSYERRRDMSSDNTNFLRFSAYGSSEDNRVNDMTIRFDNEFRLTNSHQMKLGAEISDFNTKYKIIRNDTTVVLSRNTDASMNSLYIQDTWSVAKPIELTLGLRGTDYSQSDKMYIEPRSSIIFRLTNKLSLKGAWGQYNQFVSRVSNENVLEGSRDFWILADNEINPSYAEHKIIGITYENKNFLYDIEAYYKNLKNLLEYSRRITSSVERRGIGFNQISNVPKFLSGGGTAKGIEFLIQKKRGNVTGWACYTLSKTENIFPDLNNGIAFPSDYDRTHEFKLVGMYQRGLWNASATWIMTSGKAYTSPESEYYITLLDGTKYSYIHVSDKNSNRLPNYQRLDISITRRLKRDKYDLDIGGSVFNVYNHKNIYFREYTLDTTPVLVTDKLLLGFTPTVFIRFSLK